MLENILQTVGEILNSPQQEKWPIIIGLVLIMVLLMAALASFISGLETSFKHGSNKLKKTLTKAGDEIRTVAQNVYTAQKEPENKSFRGRFFQTSEDKVGRLMGSLNELSVKRQELAIEKLKIELTAKAKIASINTESQSALRKLEIQSANLNREIREVEQRLKELSDSFSKTHKEV